MTPLLARGLSGESTYTVFQYDLVFYALVATGLGLLASMLYALLTGHDVAKKYRSASHASALIGAVASVGYVVLVVTWLTGFELQGTRWVPATTRYFTDGFRYTDWTITVPLLTVELLAVCSLAGDRLHAVRGSCVAAAALMIVTGFVGQELNDSGPAPHTAALLAWGTVSTVFYGYLYVALTAAVRQTLPTVSDRTGRSLRNALLLLVSTWGVYPLVYLVAVFADRSAGWAVTVQLLFCAADLTAKAGFGALVHKIAKLRTAEDALAGEASVPDGWPQEVWVSHEKLSAPDPAGVRHGAVRLP